MAKVAVFFVLDKPSLPENFGIRLNLDGVAPLYDNITRDGSLTKLSYPDGTAFCLRLFKKPYHVDVLMVMKELDQQPGSEWLDSFQQMARKVIEAKGDKPFYLPAYMKKAIWFPKGVSKTEFQNMVQTFTGEGEVDASDLPRLDSRGNWMMSYPEGFVFGSKNEGDFLRAMVHYGLALAYHNEMGEAVDGLSNAAALSGAQLPKMVLDIRRFSSQYLFLTPTRPGLRADALEYQHLAKNLGLDEMQKELESKLAQVVALLEAKHRAGQLDELDALAADPRTAQTVVSDDSETNEGSHGRWLLVLLLLTVIAAGAYLLGTEPGRHQLDQWLDQGSSVLSTPSNQ